MTPTFPPSPAQGETAGVSEERWQVPLWDAINAYVSTCGGDPSKHVYGNTSRMKAVAVVDAVVRQQLADSAHEVERLNAANAAMRGQYEGLQARWESAERWQLRMTGLQVRGVFDFIDGDDETEVLVQYAEERKDVEDGETLPAGLYVSLVDYPDEGCVYLPQYSDAALAPTSHDPVRSAGETHPVPERGKCETCGDFGMVCIKSSPRGSHWERCTQCDSYDKSPENAQLDMLVRASAMLRRWRKYAMEVDPQLSGPDAAVFSQTGALCFEIERTTKRPDCAQGGSPADPERQGAYDIVAGLREILAGKNVAIDPSIINRAIAALEGAK